jgi:hypothetical protein
MQHFRNHLLPPSDVKKQRPFSLDEKEGKVVLVLN